MREPSISAYNQLKKDGLLGPRQYELLQCISENPDQTDMELCRLLGYTDANRVRPRRKELYDLRLIKEGVKRLCSVTGRVSYTWQVGTPEPQMQCASEREMNHVYEKLQKMNEFQKKKVARWMGYD